MPVPSSAAVAAQVLAAGAVAWPACALAPAVVEAHVAALAATAPLADQVRAADVYLAVACLHGHPVALAEFERLLAPIKARLVRAGHDAALVDDALQTVRYRLLVATPERTAKLASYRGLGSLGGWLRVVVLRQVLELAQPRRERSERELTVAVGAIDGPLAVLVRTHGPAVRRVFRAAAAALPERDRTVLRLEIADGLTHERIAERYAVHRTTVVRWIDEARTRLAREVRRQLRGELGLGDASVDSLLGALAGHVDLSLASGLLAT
ncbi:MAG: sigma factor-like helix-turn-helix DNA-binding protein [Kofleriaceae bacterium]